MEPRPSRPDQVTTIPMTNIASQSRQSPHATNTSHPNPQRPVLWLCRHDETPLVSSSRKGFTEVLVSLSLQSPTMGLIPHPPLVGLMPHPPLAGLMPHSPLVGLMPHLPLVGLMLYSPLVGLMPHSPLVGLMLYSPLVGLMLYSPLVGLMPHPPLVGLMLYSPLVGLMPHSPLVGLMPFSPLVGPMPPSPLVGLMLYSLLVGLMSHPPLVGLMFYLPLAGLMPHSPLVGLMLHSPSFIRLMPSLDPTRLSTFISSLYPLILMSLRPPTTDTARVNCTPSSSYGRQVSLPTPLVCTIFLTSIYGPIKDNHLLVMAFSFVIL